MAADQAVESYQNVAGSTCLSLAHDSFHASLPEKPGFSTGCVALSLRRFSSPVKPMNQEPSTLYAKLLGETSTIEWKALQPFFAKGDLLWVAPGLDLIEAAQAVTQDDAEKVAAWMASGLLGKMTEAKALDVLEREPQLWAVVVSPWVMVQESAKK